MSEIKIETNERQIADFREKLSRIISNVKLIDAEREQKVQVFSPNTNHRLDIIIRMAQDIDEQCKLM